MNTDKRKDCFDSVWYPQFPLFCIVKHSGVPLPALHSNSD